MTPSAPVSIAIPAIGVHSKVFDVGLNPDGTIQVPPLDNSPLTNEAAWYRYSSAPGALGTSIIEGHVDSAASGPSVFYRLGALAVGQQIYITRRDHTLAIFRITAVRQYPKDQFPTTAVYGNARYAALRLVTRGGQFDYATHHYLSSPGRARCPAAPPPPAVAQARRCCRGSGTDCRGHLGRAGRQPWQQHCTAAGRVRAPRRLPRSAAHRNGSSPERRPGHHHRRISLAAARRPAGQ